MVFSITATAQSVIEMRPGDVVPTQETLLPLAERALPASGSQRLMMAVLSQAMAEYLEATDGPSPAARHRRRQARRWVERHDHDHWPFSFQAICDALALDADAVRHALRAKVGPSMGRPVGRAPRKKEVA